MCLILQKALADQSVSVGRTTAHPSSPHCVITLCLCEPQRAGTAEYSPEYKNSPVEK